MYRIKQKLAQEKALKREKELEQQRLDQIKYEKEKAAADKLRDAFFQEVNLMNKHHNEKLNNEYLDWCKASGLDPETRQKSSPKS